MDIMQVFGFTQLQLLLGHPVLPVACVEFVKAEFLLGAGFSGAVPSQLSIFLDGSQGGFGCGSIRRGAAVGESRCAKQD